MASKKKQDFTYKLGKYEDLLNADYEAIESKLKHIQEETETEIKFEDYDLSNY